jgi:hypothetical protein
MLLLTLVVTPALMAQVDTGSITGSVKDQSGAVIPGATPLLETATASVGQVVNQREVNNLPLNGRNYTFLAQLSAGVTMGQNDTRGLDPRCSAWSARGLEKVPGIQVQ